jgi:hypothetical protein
MVSCLLLKLNFILGIVLFLACLEEINNSNNLLSEIENHQAKNLRGVSRKSLIADGIIIETINGSKPDDYKIIKRMNRIDNIVAKTYDLSVICYDISGEENKIVRSNSLQQQCSYAICKKQTEGIFTLKTIFSPSGEIIRVT